MHTMLAASMMQHNNPIEKPARPQAPKRRPVAHGVVDGPVGNAMSSRNYYQAGGGRVPDAPQYMPYMDAVPNNGVAVGRYDQPPHVKAMAPRSRPSHDTPMYSAAHYASGGHHSAPLQHGSNAPSAPGSPQQHRYSPPGITPSSLAATISAAPPSPYASRSRGGYGNDASDAFAGGGGLQSSPEGGTQYNGPRWRSVNDFRETRAAGRKPAGGVVGGAPRVFRNPRSRTPSLSPVPALAGATAVETTDDGTYVESRTVEDDETVTKVERAVSPPVAGDRSVSPPVSLATAGTAGGQRSRGARTTTVATHHFEKSPSPERSRSPMAFDNPMPTAESGDHQSAIPQKWQQPASVAEMRQRVQQSNVVAASAAAAESTDNPGHAESTTGNEPVKSRVHADTATSPLRPAESTSLLDTTLHHGKNQSVATISRAGSPSEKFAPPGPVILTTIVDNILTSYIDSCLDAGVTDEELIAEQLTSVLVAATAGNNHSAGVSTAHGLSINGTMLFPFPVAASPSQRQAISPRSPRHRKRISAVSPRKTRHHSTSEPHSVAAGVSPELGHNVATHKKTKRGDDASGAQSNHRPRHAATATAAGGVGDHQDGPRDDISSSDVSASVVPGNYGVVAPVRSTIVFSQRAEPRRDAKNSAAEVNATEASAAQYEASNAVDRSPAGKARNEVIGRLLNGGGAPADAEDASTRSKVREDSDRPSSRWQSVRERTRSTLKRIHERRGGGESGGAVAPAAVDCSVHDERIVDPKSPSVDRSSPGTTTSLRDKVVERINIRRKAREGFSDAMDRQLESRSPEVQTGESRPTTSTSPSATVSPETVVGPPRGGAQQHRDAESLATLATLSSLSSDESEYRRQRDAHQHRGHSGAGDDENVERYDTVARGRGRRGGSRNFGEDRRTRNGSERRHQKGASRDDRSHASSKRYPSESNSDYDGPVHNDDTPESYRGGSGRRTSRDDRRVSVHKEKRGYTYTAYRDDNRPPSGREPSRNRSKPGAYGDIRYTDSDDCRRVHRGDGRSSGRSQSNSRRRHEPSGGKQKISRSDTMPVRYAPDYGTYERTTDGHHHHSSGDHRGAYPQRNLRHHDGVNDNSERDALYHDHRRAHDSRTMTSSVSVGSARDEQEVDRTSSVATSSTVGGQGRRKMMVETRWVPRSRSVSEESGGTTTSEHGLPRQNTIPALPKMRQPLYRIDTQESAASSPAGQRASESIATETVSPRMRSTAVGAEHCSVQEYTPSRGRREYTQLDASADKFYKEASALVQSTRLLLESETDPATGRSLSPSVVRRPDGSEVTSPLRRRHQFIQTPQPTGAVTSASATTSHSRSTTPPPLSGTQVFNLQQQQQQKEVVESVVGTQPRFKNLGAAAGQHPPGMQGNALSPFQHVQSISLSSSNQHPAGVQQPTTTCQGVTVESSAGENAVTGGSRFRRKSSAAQSESSGTMELTF